MSRRGAALGAGLLVLVGLLLIAWCRHGPGERSSSPPAPDGPLPSAAQERTAAGSSTGGGTAATPAASAASQGATSHRPPGDSRAGPRRVRVPRPERLSDRRTRPRVSEVGGLTDRRAEAGEDAAEVMASITAGMELVRDDITECLDAWYELTPDLEASVDLAFQLDSSGLQDAWVDDHDDVPFGPLTCFGGAVYEVDWSGMTSSPIEVTFTFDAEPER